MLPLAIATVLFARQGSTISDYFPVAPNTRWTYSWDSNGLQDDLVFTALPPIKIGTTLCPEIQMSEAGMVTNFFYTVAATSLALVAIDPQQPFAQPRTLIQLGSTSGKWRYDFMQEGEPVNVDCSVREGIKRNVLGTERDSLCVTSAAVYGNKNQIKITQTAYYAKGIGLVEMDTDQRAGNKHTRITQTLVKFEPPSKEQ